MIEVHAEFPQREVIQANAVVDNEEKTVSEVIISAKPEITGVTASVDNETGTPYVDITETGTGTEFSFDLAFHNLKGDKGEQGEQGEPGQDGQDGTDGTDGQDGFSPIATVEPIQDGAKITITDKDGTTTTNVYNGTDGTDGADGQAATVTVGTTTTGAAGTNASVVNSGTSSAAVFDFVIPRGDKGDKGDKGDTGSQGPQGVQGEQGPQGIQGPKGETGATGQDGYSPTANVTQSGDITTITITDKNGTTTESIDLSDFGKVKSVNNTQPDANGNVTIQTGGANTDLSNLTATGEAHFLKNSSSVATSLTISGTASTYQSTVNLGVYSAVGNPGSTALGYNAQSSGSVSIALGYNATSSANGAIQIGQGTNSTANSLAIGFGDDSEHNPLEYQLLDGATGLIPDARISSNFEQTSNKVTSISSSSTNTQYPSAKLLYDQLALKQNTSTAVTHPASSAIGGVDVPVFVNSNGVVTSTGKSIASSRFDGKWVLSYHGSLVTASSAGSSQASISTYLPSDSYDYEVMFYLTANYDSTACDVAIGNIASPLSNDCIRIKGRVRNTSASVFCTGIIPIKSSARIIYTQRGAKLSSFQVDMIAYRRIGTNSQEK